MTGKCIYRLDSILFISLCTILSGGNDYHDMQIFGEGRLEWLSKYIDLPNDTPSHDTFERVFQNIDIEEFRKCLHDITLVSKQNLEKQIIAIDGKKLKGVNPHSKGNSGLYIVTAWACENQLSLGEVRVQDKSNEITAIPELFKKIDVAGSTVSIDAMGCQVEIARIIIEHSADYILSAKNNQGSLTEEIKGVFDYAKPEDENKTWDYGHGRYETRICKILSAKEYLSPIQLARWPDIKTLIKIDSTRDINDLSPTGTRYYISSHDRDAKYFNESIRKHWSIENQLHWNLDVVLNEDKNRSRKDFSSENLNTLRKLCLRFLVQHEDKLTKPKRRFQAALQPNYLEEILNVKI